jgi:hypothetical protein
MAGGKRASEGKGEPSQKHTAIDLEMEIYLLHKYESEQHSSAVACGFDLTVTTLNTIMKDGAHMKGRMNFIFHLIHVYLSTSIVFNMCVL